MRKIPKAARLAILVVLTLATLAGAYGARRFLAQGLDDDFWATYPTASVTMDRYGVPTIEGKTWNEVIQAQGFVVAASRLWQMDLIRRKAAGRLAELFGDAAFEHDARMRQEGRTEVVQAAVSRLPVEERKTCELFAQGVNAFIDGHGDRVGAEYFLLGKRPAPWTCADSMLVMLEMTDTLTSSAAREARAEVWRRRLSPAWEALLFPLDHPWNEPMFRQPYQPVQAGPQLPPAAEHLPMRALSGAELGRANGVAKQAIAGSNNWTWRGRTGTFLANDPHLGQMVPGLWYAVRLRVSASEWAVGAALPGLPGVIIGMNPGLAWAFTNTGEDVDDYLLETLSDDGRRYVERLEAGEPVWRDVERRTYQVQVNGEEAPREVLASFTHRGPLVKVPELGDGIHARQWLALKEGVLRLPVLAMMRAQTFPDFDRALDGMTIPSQNVLVTDRSGGMGYRMSGTGVVRNVSGLRPRLATAGEWGGFEPVERRLRRYIGPDEGMPTYLATANERVWVDPFGASWASDDRKARIVEVLASRDDFLREDMEKLQLDTRARFRRQLLQWVAGRASASSDVERRLVGSWQAWDGDSRTDARIFAQSTVVEDRLMAVLTGRVAAAFSVDAPAPDKPVTYAWHLDRAWLLAVLDADGDQGLRPFGLTAAEVAQHLLAFVAKQDGSLETHEQANRWSAKHPFVGRIPLVGSLFEVDMPEQWGAPDLVLAEKPGFGPSMRLVWDLGQPGKSTWIFPVGQSGHAASAHYHDLQALWRNGGTLPVFPEGSDWGFD